MWSSSFTLAIRVAYFERDVTTPHTFAPFGACEVLVTQLRRAKATPRPALAREMTSAIVSLPARDRELAAATDVADVDEATRPVRGPRTRRLFALDASSARSRSYNRSNRNLSSIRRQKGLHPNPLRRCCH